MHSADETHNPVQIRQRSLLERNHLNPADSGIVLCLNNENIPHVDITVISDTFKATGLRISTKIAYNILVPIRFRHFTV